MTRLMNCSWPGNVRELQNVIEKAVALAAGPAVEPQDLDFSTPPTGPAGESLLHQKNRMVTISCTKNGRRSSPNTIGTTKNPRKLAAWIDAHFTRWRSGTI